MKRALIFVLFNVLVNVVISQENKLSSGYEFAPLFSTINNGENNNYRISYSTGFSLEFRLNKSFSIFSSLNYKKQGYFKEFVLYELILPEYKIIKTYQLQNLDYVYIPILFMYHIYQPICIFFKVGISYGYLLNSWEINYFGKKNNNSIQFNKNIFEYIVGIGIEPFSERKLSPFVEIRGSYGINNVYKSSEINLKGKLVSGMICFGIKYNFKKNN